MNRRLWVAQVALALLFVFAGAMKFVMSADDLTKDTDLSAAFLRFIGVCEVFGGVGLVLPGITRVAAWLTPVAAAGLVVIMIGATAITVADVGMLPALFPCAVGLAAAFVMWGRWRATGIRASLRVYRVQAAS